MEIEKLVQIFIDELEEETDEFSTTIIKLEEESTKLILIDDIYINVHTIKGSSNTLLNTMKTEEHEVKPIIESIAKLTHRFEDYIALLKEEKMELTTIQINRLFEFDSLLRLLYHSLQNDTIEPFEKEVENFLNSIKDIDKTDLLTNPVSSTYKDSLESNKLFFEITLSSDEELKHGYLHLVYRDIEEEYEECFFNPTKEQLLKAEDFSSITLQITTSKTELEVISFLKDLLNVASVKPLIHNTTPNNAIKTPLLLEGELPTINREELSEKTVSKKNQYKKNSIRIEPKRIDNVLKHTSKLVILKNKLDEFIIQNDFLAGTKKRKELENIFDEINLHVDFLQEAVLNIRMTPLEELFSRFPRDVRELANKYNKPTTFETFGGTTEIDKSILDELFEPFMHLIRNSIIHGIEFPEERINKGKKPKGTISIKAKHDKNKVIIEISDDGKGINVDALKQSAFDKKILPFSTLSTLSREESFELIFKTGLSSTKYVSEYAGRGVGMDAVRKKVEELNGTISIDSKTDIGTTITLTLPLTTAIIEGMITKINDDFYTFPISQVEEVLHIHRDEIKVSSEQPFIFLRDEEVPVVFSYDFFNIPRTKPEYTFLKVMIVRSHNYVIGFTIDEYIGQQSIVVKPLPIFLQNNIGIGSCNILGDGSISLIVDTNDILTHLINSNDMKNKEQTDN